MDAQKPICPGCHFACTLAEYQCGRGRRLLERWEADGTLPERRRPAPPGTDGPRKRPPADGMLMHMLDILADSLRRRSADPQREVALALMRHEELAAPRILAERTKIEAAELDRAIQKLQDGELAHVETDEHGTTFVYLTETGTAEAREWEQERARQDEEFLSSLSEDEKGRLLDIIFKLLEPNFARPQRP